MSTPAPYDDGRSLIPSLAADAVLGESEDMPEGTPEIKGVDFNKEVTLDSLMATYTYTGFQATNIGLAIEQINNMIKWRLSDEPITEDTDDDLKDPAVRAATKCTIFLGFTSNMISCGIREVLCFLAQHRMVDVMVTTGGGIEEDFLKCLAPHYMGDFYLPGKQLRKKGINRIGNMLVPNKNYCLFEDFFGPILNAMHDEQEKDGVVWTPSKMIHRMGKEINNPESVYYWAYKHNIPVYCPAITDGSIGDMIFFHSYKRPGFVVDIAGDIRGINDHALNAKKSGMLILGGGTTKHHICNANLMRNGADYSVFINTGQASDGSDSGAAPDEAISWGKIKLDAKPVKVHGDASMIFPLVVSQTFAKHGTRLDVSKVGEATEMPASGTEGAGAGSGSA